MFLYNKENHPVSIESILMAISWFYSRTIQLQSDPNASIFLASKAIYQWYDIAEAQI